MTVAMTSWQLHCSLGTWYLIGIVGNQCSLHYRFSVKEVSSGTHGISTPPRWTCNRCFGRTLHVGGTCLGVPKQLVCGVGQKHHLVKGILEPAAVIVVVVSSTGQLSSTKYDTVVELKQCFVIRRTSL